MGAGGLALVVAGCSAEETTTDPDETTTSTDETTTNEEVTTTPPTTGTGETPTAGVTTTTTTAPTTTAAPEPAQVVEVGRDARFRFDPETFTVAVGETIEWVWRTSGHNVTPNETPEGADWTGSPGAPSRTLSQGATYRFTPTVPGEYSYYCAPHRGQDMVGSFTVEG